MPRLSRIGRKDVPAKQYLHAAQNLPQLSRTDRSDSNRDPAAKVLKYLDDFRSANDTKALHEEGYEVDYDRLVGVGNNSAVFLARQLTPSAMPITHIAQAPADRPAHQPGAPGVDIAAKVIAKKWISSKRPLKTRTGNLKLALALGQTKPENNILHVIDVFKTPERIFIFMQYCSYGNVISFIRRNGQVSLKLTQRWNSQMAAALSFLHKFHVAHRNYKLENVLIDSALNAKLTGFGLSKFCIDLQTKEPVLSRTICGSEPYLAPEMLKESKERLYDPKQADVWAFGVGLFLCSTRRYPFEADNLRSLRDDQMAQRYLERDTKHRLRGVVIDLLAQIFVIDPSQRPTMQELINNNRWLSPAGPEAQPITQLKTVSNVTKVAKLSPPPAAAARPESPTPMLEIARSPQMPSRQRQQGWRQTNKQRPAAPDAVGNPNAASARPPVDKPPERERRDRERSSLPQLKPRTKYLRNHNLTRPPSPYQAAEGYPDISSRVSGVSQTNVSRNAQTDHERVLSTDGQERLAPVVPITFSAKNALPHSKTKSVYEADEEDQ